MSCTSSSKSSTESGSGGAIIAARHGERLDYILRDSGSNWIPTTSRPWDPPLTEYGQKTQTVELGKRIARQLKEKGLPRVSAVYSSPLLRCCQTSMGAIIGLQQEGGVKEDEKLQIRMEHGLIESSCEKWYTSWGLPSSDSTWGYRPPIEPIEEETVHPMAKVAVQKLLLSPTEMQEKLTTGEEEGKHDDIVDTTYASIHTLNPYGWNNFETRKLQLARMEKMSALLAAKHPNETILLVAHGSPVTHLYEVITGKSWREHGVSAYASFSIYGHCYKEEEEKKIVDDEAVAEMMGGEEKQLSWTEVEINNSAHKLDESSTEFKSGR